MITCNKCDAEWSGVGRAHHNKEGCHRTFSGITAFTKHIKYSKCLDPAEIGMRQDEKGIWIDD